ncbi:Integrase zinc binding domain [Popillia japonica]|uniref:RNA-directed DNA polymerase n=1 Tax=Popillia japonica TaxID=7064 RepID=A0AAW1IUD7_POPJA
MAHRTHYVHTGHAASPSCREPDHPSRTGPTTSIPAMQLRLAAGNQTIQADQQGTLDARTTNGVHFQCPASDLQADIILGLPWLIEQQAVIDLTRGCIHIGREQRQTIHFCRQTPSKAAPAPPLDCSTIPIGNGDWTDDQRREFLQALQEFPEPFEEGGAVATTATVRHTIRLKDETPVRVQEFQYSVEHIPGRENQLPDALSRNPGSDLTTGDLQETERLLPSQASSGQQAYLMTEEEPLLHVIQDPQREDPTGLKRTAGLPYDRRRAPTPRDPGPPAGGPAYPAPGGDGSLLSRPRRDPAMGFRRRTPKAQSRRTTNHCGTPSSPGPGETQPWVFEEGLLKHKVGERRTIVVPPAARPQVIQRHHDHYTAGHPGIEETIRAIRQRYFSWHAARNRGPRQMLPHLQCLQKRSPPDASPAETPCTRRTIRGRIRRRRWTNDRHPHRQPIRNRRPRLVLPVDRGQGREEGYHHRHRRVPGRDLPAIWVPKGHPEIFQRFGYPRAILSDNGPQFTSIAWEAALRKWQSLHWTTPIYHPRANPVERRNQELKKGLRIQLEGQTPDRWDGKLNHVLFNLRCRQNAATGYTPAKALFGFGTLQPALPPRRRHRTPTEDQPEPIAQRTEKVHANELRYREKCYAQPDAQMPIQLRVGDQVLVKAHPPSPPPRPSPHQDSISAPSGWDPTPWWNLPASPWAPRQHFSPKWMGPYPVVELAGLTAVWVERPGAQRAKYHLDQVRRARRPRPPQPQQPPPDDAVPQQPPPDDAVPQQPLPDDAVPQQPLPDDAVPQQAPPDDAVPQQPLPDDAVPQQPLPGAAVPQTADSRPADHK